MKSAFLSLFTALSLCAGADNDYHYYVDLNKVNNDKVSVQLTAPDLVQNEIEFAFPAMVPVMFTLREVMQVTRSLLAILSLPIISVPLTVLTFC